MRNKYILALQYGTMADIMFKDLIDDKRTQIFYVSNPLKNPWLNFVRSVHTSIKLTKYFEPPLKKLWYVKDLLNAIDEKTFIIFQIDTMIHIGMKLLKLIKQTKPSAKMILLLVDSIHAHSWTMNYARSYIFNFEWDLILSYDDYDCREYGFTYIGLSYYSRLNEIEKSGSYCDLYYVGSVKNEDSRSKILENIYSNCMREKITCNFILSGMNRFNVNSNGIKVLYENIPYIQVLNDVLASNCILEIVQPGQNRQTVRYMEAVCYNKKLLTNNSHVRQLPYYNQDYIRYFDNELRIDYDWLKHDIPVNYHYRNDFSPLKIYQIIEHTLN